MRSESPESSIRPIVTAEALSQMLLDIVRCCHIFIHINACVCVSVCLCVCVCLSVCVHVCVCVKKEGTL